MSIMRVEEEQMMAGMLLWGIRQAYSDVLLFMVAQLTVALDMVKHFEK